MTKQVPVPLVFQMRLESHYALPVASFHSERETLWNGPTEVAYEQFPDNHSRFQNFVSLSRALEDAATHYNAEWTMENVRKEVSAGKWQERDGRAHYDGAYADLISQVGTLTSSAVAAIGLLKFIRPILVQWLANRGARMFQVKIGTTEISVQGGYDIDKALELLEKAACDYGEEGEVPKTRKSPTRQSNRGTKKGAKKTTRK